MNEECVLWWSCWGCPRCLNSGERGESVEWVLVPVLSGEFRDLLVER